MLPAAVTGIGSRIYYWGAVHYDINPTKLQPQLAETVFVILDVGFALTLEETRAENQPKCTCLYCKKKLFPSQKIDMWKFCIIW